MTPFQRALCAMNAAIYAAAKMAREQESADAESLKRMALQSDDIVDRNTRLGKP